MDRHQEYYVNLSKELIHMGRHEEAEAAATRALALNPKLSHARFNRGLARNAIGLHLGAKTDFGTIIQTDPLFYLARSAYEEVAKQVNDSETDQDGSYALPIYFAVAELPTDFDHLGSKTCRFYNHDGCTRGVSCSFRHAPDIESVRDINGRNVCLHYLLGKCKWGDYSCIYSHSKSTLPDGWWNDAEKVAAVKEALGKFQAGRKKAHDERIAKTVTKPKNARGPNSRRSKKAEQRERNYGFTDDEVLELAAQGVKPWDDDANDVLAVIKGGVF